MSGVISKNARPEVWGPSLQTSVPPKIDNSEVAQQMPKRMGRQICSPHGVAASEIANKFWGPAWIFRRARPVVCPISSCDPFMSTIDLR